MIALESIQIHGLCKKILQPLSCSFCMLNSTYSYVTETQLDNSRNLKRLHCIRSAWKSRLYEQVRNAGHSKWANIKFKKMHKDNARAKTFGRLSLEIIQAVRENGPDPNYNPKLDALIVKAKSSSMPKDRIEGSIKNATRDTNEKRNRVILQARGPGKCGLLIDVLSPNIVRCKHEIKSILKKNECTFIEDGSVVFMFEHKGVLTVEDTLSSSKDAVDVDAKEQAEEMAILIGAENVLFNSDEDRKVIQFICPALEILELQKRFTTDYNDLRTLSADTQYLANSLVEIPDEFMMKTDRIIDFIAEHPDVMTVYDNIIGYPSKTIKLCSEYE